MIGVSTSEVDRPINVDSAKLTYMYTGKHAIMAVQSLS